jgi:Uma2 family endonuclease
MDAMTSLYTRADYDRLPEGFPAQLVEGQLVRDPAPAFGHQRIALEIAERLRRLVGPRRTGIAPVDVAVDEFNVYQPDVVVFRVPLDDDASGYEAGAPLLVVEVLSPSTARRDRVVKRTRLLDIGVEEVWLIDRSSRVIEVYDRHRYRDVPRRALRDVAIASSALEGFELTPDVLFEG